MPTETKPTAKVENATTRKVRLPRSLTAGKSITKKSGSIVCVDICVDIREPPSKVIASSTDMCLPLRELKLPAIGLLLAIPLSAATCESLSALSLAHATLTMAQIVPATAKIPAYCRVALTLRPTSDSEIKAEVWLPIENWNGKLEANGNGGWSGSISATTLASGLARGYATAMSDLGHTGSSASFALGHPEKLIDFGYRAAHEATVAAKAIVSAYYGNGPKYSYWTGCSAGGRSALMEAQRFPDDFDGIVAGSPGLNWIGRATQAMWIAQASHKDESSYIPPAKYAMIHQAVLEACDASDGVKDGVLNDPTKCRFDPAALRCKDADGPGCLTNPQVAAAQAIYSAVINPRTKQQLSPGSERGSELGWNYGRTSAARNRLRFVSLRRVQRSCLGLHDLKLRHRHTGERNSQCDGSSSGCVRQTRWQADPVSRLERSANRTIG